jgi:hypothetical protein
MRSSQLGFTLVEAMVSIIILTMSLVATYSWVDVSIEMLLRSDEVMTQELLIGDLTEELGLVDLDEINRGEMSLEDLRLEWEAVRIENKSGLNNRGFVGYYDHTLYEIEINVFRAAVPVSAYVTRRVTSRRVRGPRG